MAKKSEKRLYTRFDVQWPVTIQTSNDLVEGMTVNISAAGIRIDYQRPLQAEDIIRIFVIPPDQEVIVISGELVWSDEDNVDEGSEHREQGSCSMMVPIHDQEFLRKVIDKTVKKKKTRKRRKK
jgi:hypothetical protein